MITPAFKNCYEVEIIDDTHVLVLGERGNELLTGAAYVVVAEGLAAGRSVQDIIDDAASGVTAAEVFYVLSRLEELQLVRNPHDTMPQAARGFWDALGVDPADAQQRLTQATVTLVALDGVDSSSLAGALDAAGLTRAEEGSFCVVLTDDYLRPELAAANDRYLAAGTTWMLARTVGSVLWLGPVFRRGATACWECMADRMRGLRPAESYVQKQKNYTYPRLASNYSLPSSELAGAGLVATEIAKCVAGAGSALDSMLITIDLSSFTVEEHVVVRRPQCPACGDIQAWRDRVPEPLQLVSRILSRIKGPDADGGQRTASPAQTLARYGHHVSRLTGVVRQLTVSRSLDASIAPVCVSGPNASTVETLGSLRGYFRDSNGGKGRTAAQAKAGALCEAIERHSGSFQGYEHRIRASYASLGDEAIHPNACMGFSEGQYAVRNEKRRDRYSRAPEPFDETAMIDWTPLWSLTHQRFRYLPTAYCYYEYPRMAEERFCWPDSNGCAAGNSTEEAILQGFFELVERDSVALWWYNQVRRPAVDLAAFGDPYFTALTKYYASYSRDLWVLDVTADLGIPAFVAVSPRTDSAKEDILLGFGCHLDPIIAIQRALTEVNQFFPAVIARHADPSAELRVSDGEILEWLTESTLANRPYLIPAEGPALGPSNYRAWGNDDLRDDVEQCVRIAAERGLETLVLDQTRPDIGLPVVRVVVPGLRHFWARCAPGRLYDVPVELGWLAAPLPESALNRTAVVW
jgi:ribosomal protein S12 methylthiotransferase accessory factor